MMKDFVVATIVIMAGIIVVLIFMPGSFTGGTEDLKIVGMCDSVYVNDDGDVEFCIRNKSDELFYIDRPLSEGEVYQLREKCSKEVITLVFYEPGLIAKALEDSHRITRVEQNERIIYSSGTAMGITPR